MVEYLYLKCKLHVWTPERKQLTKTKYDLAQLSGSRPVLRVSLNILNTFFLSFFFTPKKLHVGYKPVYNKLRGIVNICLLEPWHPLWWKDYCTAVVFWHQQNFASFVSYSLCICYKRHC